MTVNPYVYIAPPDIEPYRYGLFGATQDVPWQDHFLIGGAEWDSLASVAAQVYPAGLFESGGAGGSKSLPSWPGTSKAWPFAVYAGIECGTIGYTPEEFTERANRILTQSSQHAAEDALWTGGPGNSPALNVAGTHVVSGSGAVDIVTAIGELEDWLADNYAGVGQVHAKRYIAGLAANHHVLKEDPDSADGQHYMTPVGSRWVFGGGYDGTGPNAAAPSTGQMWIYITGQTFISRGPSEMPADFEQAIIRLTNQEILIAEQPYIIGVDGTWAAALVDLTL